MKTFAIISLSLLASSVASEFTPCPLIHSYFPSPSLSSIAKANLSIQFEAAFDELVHNSGHPVYGNISSKTTSFSVIYFSGSNLSSNGQGLPPIFEYHYTSPYDTARNMTTITADTEFPIAEVSTVFTIYAWLTKMGSQWDTPITAFLPELKTQGNVSSVAWEDITIGALAGHTSGLPRTSSVCTIGKPCDPKAFIDDIESQGPIFLPDTTPAISYAAFQILAMAVERVTGSECNGSYADAIRNILFEPLGMKNTSVFSPYSSNFPGINMTGEGEQAALSLFSTANDLARAGNAILSSRLVSPSSTRKWISRSVDTSNLRNGVGYPWEIYRAGESPISPILDVLTKSGAIGPYASYFGISPDYNIGFAILARDFTSITGQLDLNAYADVASDSLSSFQGVAANETGFRYAGIFKSQSGGRLVLNITGPGLEVLSMTSQDMGDVKTNIADSLNIAAKSLDFRIYPSSVQDEKQHQFVSIFQDKDASEDAGTPTCITWQDVDILGKGLGRFIFKLDKDGVATSVIVDGDNYMR